ncbi:ABC transporter permease [Acuticoccus mangrovi]|uniref:ABC transporter permease n=1 Tax=Acuticoccus mangrovi TaxID=2796142 RepID=A0A934IIC3_9HYPH|nr:ABC transporter permease [Acuticoccus mangrovi]MBJ3777018.1 ABC transporter permease [Acuticoccus mangrovi]
MSAADTTAAPATRAPSNSYWRLVFRRLRRNRPAMAGLVCLVVVILAAVTAPIIAPYDPMKVSLADAYQSPNAAHLMGTDKLGRDILSRVLWGSRNSLKTGFFAVLWGLAIGGVLGSLALWGGRIVDAVVMRFTDVLLAFPGILLAIGVISWLGRGDVQMTLAVGLSLAPIFTRLLRASLLSLQESDFVLALRSVGVPRRQILFRHMLPNALTPLIVQATLQLGTTILTVAGLGFLGLGPEDPRIPEWGTMLIEGAQMIQTFPHLVLGPGACLVAIVVSVNLLGDGLRDALDPRVRR